PRFPKYRCLCSSTPASRAGSAAPALRGLPRCGQPWPAPRPGSRAARRIRPETAARAALPPRRAVGQPFAGHLRAVLQGVESSVVDAGFGREVENNDRHLRPLHHRQHRARQRVGCDVQKDNVHVGLPELRAGGKRRVGGIDQPEVHHLRMQGDQLGF
nr:hypothetical protein [Tanacetum cinerariifolium]